MASKPVIGIVGGIGSGKSFVAKVLGELGCRVIDSDYLGRRAWTTPGLITRLDQAFAGKGKVPRDHDGQPNRRKLAELMFGDDELRRRIDAVIHPWIDEQRRQTMMKHAGDPTTRAFVWDSPLLIEAGLADACDAVLFVDTPFDLRLQRVKDSRGWTEAELKRRESAQMPIDEKRRRATHVVRGDASADWIRFEMKKLLNAMTPVE
jgi:dephospho-CoA kinase